MIGSKKKTPLTAVSEANITPLADVTTTLIVVFLVTMPTILWSGIEVTPPQGDAGSQVVSSNAKPDEAGLLTVAVRPDGVLVNKKPVALDDLEPTLRSRLAERKDKTVVMVPSDKVELGNVVTVLDLAKASGASSLALLNLEER